MKDKLQDYWNKTAYFRNSIPNFYKELVTKDPVYPDENILDKINRKLLNYKEIKILYEKTSIKPVYYFIGLLICLVFIFIGFFDHFLTILIATASPLYLSYKTLQNHINDNDKENENENDDEDNEEYIKDMTNWLTYWVVYSFFINFEGIFRRVLIYIPFYFFIKVIFLLLCFLPQYQLSVWLYDKFIKDLFLQYEKKILNMSNQFIKSLSYSEE